MPDVTIPIHPPVKDPKNEKGEPVKAPLWFNIYFSRTGRSYPDPQKLFPSESEAKVAADFLIKNYAHLPLIDLTNGESQPPYYIVRAMQVPYAKQ